MTINERMKKNYELRYRFHLPRRIPVIIRLDGKAFHTYTRGCSKPYDARISADMMSTAMWLQRNIQGCKFAYTQSDEISLLLTDYDTITTDAWFDYNLTKITSVSAAMASTHFSFWNSFQANKGELALFDARAFSLPKEEVANYFISRQVDCISNSKQALAQSLYSPKELHGKRAMDLVAMCKKKGFDWSAIKPQYQLGYCVDHTNTPSVVDFRKERKIFEQYLTNG